VALLVIVLASGCLYRPPAEVKFSVDRTTVNPGGTIHVVIVVNNTGKVGLTDAALIIKSGGFTILQEPRFPKFLPVGKSVRLVWILQAPGKPGKYDLKLSLELTDELKRVWTGFYAQFLITVSEKTVPNPNPINVTLSVPKVTRAGSVGTINVTLVNRGSTPVDIDYVNLTLLPGMKFIHEAKVPSQVPKEGTVKLVYYVREPYAYRKGYVSVIVKYSVGDGSNDVIESRQMEVVWRPWNATLEALKSAYGSNYQWLNNTRVVDAYWVHKYNSSSSFSLERIRVVALPIVENETSEEGAARALYRWVVDHYAIGGRTTTLKPAKMLEGYTLSYPEAQILLTAMLRSVNIPARLVTLYNGTDCTMDPLTEFYTADGWDVIDVSHGIVGLGSVDDYVASPYFPRVYQLVTQKGYRIVAQAPQTMVGHEHVDVTAYFMIDLQERLLNKVSQRVEPQLRSKLNLVLDGFDDNGELYTLFLFASAPPDQLNQVLEHNNVGSIQRTIRALYEFYWNVPWSNNFTWKVFMEGLS